MIIRRETKEDFEQVYQVVKAAFSSAAHSDGGEQDLVVALRRSGAFLLDLSLLAQVKGEIVGHILFTKATVGELTVVALAPLSVLPAHQRQGIGTALIKEGHRIAKSMGFPYSVVLGSETYYPRLGYVPARTLGIEAPFPVPSENWMAIRLLEDAEPVCGTLQYAPEFGL